MTNPSKPKTAVEWASVFDCGYDVRLKATILRLRRTCKKQSAEIDRLEAEIKALVEIIEPGSWK